LTNKDVEKHTKRIFDVASEEELEGHLKKTQEIRWRNFGEKIRFYAPSFLHYKTSYYCSSRQNFQQSQ